MRARERRRRIERRRMAVALVVTIYLAALLVGGGVYVAYQPHIHLLFPVGFIGLGVAVAIGGSMLSIRDYKVRTWYLKI